MFRYIIRRILWLIPVIIGVSLLVYTLLELTPGTVIDGMITDGMTREEVETLRRQYNLDRHMLYRYGLYMLNLIQGDLGVSDTTGMNIWNQFITRLPNTIILSFVALIIGASVSIPLGIRAARRAGTITDNAVTVFSLIGTSMPVFWLGLLLLLIFSQQLRWLPSGGNRHGIQSVILPAICSAVGMIAQTARQTRSNMLEVLSADYMRTARAKGVPEKTVIRRHALGNAWIPVLTALGTSLSAQLAGSVVVETVFAWPGIGRMAAEAVMARDVTMTTGVVIMTTILYALVHLIVDLLYALVDPRIRSQYSRAGKRKKRAAAGAGIYGQSEARFEEGIASKSEDSRQAEHGDIEPHAADGAGYSRLPAQNLSETVAAPETQKSFATRDSFRETEANAAEREAGSRGGLATMKYKKRGQISEIFHRIKKNKGATVGLIISSLLLLTLIASILFVSYDSVTVGNVADRFTRPGFQFPFGTDNMGRNTFLRVIYGIRFSLAIGFGAVVICTIFGIALGSFAGFYGGKTDDFIMRFSDILASIPGLLFGMVIVTMLGQSLRNLIIAVGVTGIPVITRMARASVLTVRDREFVESARAIGISNVRIIFSQVLPNALSPVIVTITASLGVSIIVASSMSYLGLGIPVPNPEWGTLVAMGRDYVRAAPWLITFPGLFIMITVLAFNLLGDGLRDALDPKLKGKR